MQEVTIDQAASAATGAGVIVDVREPAEYRDGHIPGAVNIPMGQLTARLSEIDRHQPVYVVCASGNRSSAMTDVLTAAGFDAFNVAGGTSAWIRSGLPVEK
ncbi:rhodanese-like domain-containing protein [Nocardioides sp. SOB77]|uniref:Rhodanese-like domain-containing protein n=1 Tax=Nocardioides oceani TaxID=3058369 RepID=A0ABT8FL71_9ACTN|nr:rhodanese-like domain-containing protein [Nocardioides oceani]MDN4175215.1 rhodanese-like domain-containing protein [Nocardioides oceani]